MILNISLLVFAVVVSLLLLQAELMRLRRMGNIRQALVNLSISTLACFLGFRAVLSILDRLAR